MCVFFFFFCLSIYFPGPKGLFLPKGGAKGGGGAPAMQAYGGANSGGGAPMQALAPGRWRPSVRHCEEQADL